MKTTILRILSVVALLAAFSCGSKTHDHEHTGTDDSLAAEGNQALYEEVMKIHDEAMAKMDSMYRLKRALKNRLSADTTLAEELKKSLGSAVAKLDSADRGMMDWMHKFEPIADSEGEEKAREYLESEMEKVKRVREEIREALSEAKEQLKNK